MRVRLIMVIAGLAVAPNCTLAEEVDDQIEALFTPGRDLVDIKITIDAIVEGHASSIATVSAIDDMAEQVQLLVEKPGTSAQKLTALKRYLYEPGPWNKFRPFSYDLADPLGENLESRKLARYLETRRGNCVTMPILFLLLADRLRLTVTLAEAPLHLFVRYTDDEGSVWNIETTSGGGFTRDAWYRAKLPMTDKAVSNGVYLRSMSREEVTATFATYLVEHFSATGEYERALDIARVILRFHPRSVYTWVKKGTVLYRLLNRDIISRYNDIDSVPSSLRSEADAWFMENALAFRQAELLGWRPEELQNSR